MPPVSISPQGRWEGAPGYLMGPDVAVGGAELLQRSRISPFRVRRQQEDLPNAAFLP